MSAFILKIIASICMLIDHVGAVFPNSTPFFLRVIGRVSFPLYACLIAEGCLRTRSAYKYMLRLGLFALISQAPFMLAFHDVGSNVFFTLLLGVACVVAYEAFKSKLRSWLLLMPTAALALGALYHLYVLGGTIVPQSRLVFISIGVAAAATLALCRCLPEREAGAVVSPPIRALAPLTALVFVLCGDVFMTDYGAFGVLLIFALYLASPRQVPSARSASQLAPPRRVARTVVLAAGMLFEYGIMTVSPATNGWAFNVYGLMFTVSALVAAALVFFYNGERGRRLKWAFYVFYPAHLAVLALLARLL